MTSEADEKDLLRDTWLRFLGYTNEVGEAFRPLVPKNVVRLSYGVATTYVLADVFSKTKDTYEATGKAKGAAVTACDVFLWQMFASVIIPGITINRITSLSSYLLAKSKKGSGLVRLVPTAIGLISIPFIIRPIDDFVTFGMDKTYRSYVRVGDS